MTKDLIKRIRRVYGIILSIVIIVAGLCLMAACVGIYRSGDHPFSREAVAAAFQPIAVPVYLCLAMVVLGFILHFSLPEEEEKVKPQKQYAVILKRLLARTDLSRCDEALRAAIEAQQKKRRLHRILSILLLAAGSAVFLGYALNSSHFHQSQINDSMIRAMVWLVPSMAVPFAYAVYTAFSDRASIRKEIELLKQADASAKIPAKLEPVRDPAKTVNTLRCVIICVAAAILIFGFCTGGTADVLTKAINICTECVGLG